MAESKVKRCRWLAGVALGAAAFALILPLNSCSTTDNVLSAIPQIEGATFAGDKACMDCHTNITRAFPASPHARLHLDKSQMAGQYGCESCHGPASKHIAMAGSGGREKFIINPGKDPESCFQCHLATRAEFHFPQHHPVIEGKMNCVQCHDPHGMDIMKPAGGLAMARQNGSSARDVSKVTAGVWLSECSNGSPHQSGVTVRDNEPDGASLPSKFEGRFAHARAKKPTAVANDHWDLRAFGADPRRILRSPRDRPRDAEMVAMVSA